MISGRTASLALLFLFVTAPCNAWDNLGRLFTTPEQRERIDQMRFSPPEGSDAISAPEEPRSAPLIFNGVLVRQNDVRSVWINGSPYSGNVLLRPDGSILLTLPTNGQQVRLKPGQGVDPATGRILQPWERSAIEPAKTSTGKQPGDSLNTTPVTLTTVTDPDDSAEETGS